MKIYNDNSLTNLSNSILKHFGAESFHDSIPEIDEALKGHKKVVAVLFDGMGQNIIQKHLKENSFIRKHYLITVNSTMPPTTAAATTAFLTGKYPIETGWISWATYFKEYDRNIILFRNKDFNTGEDLPQIDGVNIANKYFPTKQIFELIVEGKSGAKTFNIMKYPIQQDGPKGLFFSGPRKLNKVLKNNDNCFVYFYWNEPDGTMHEYGIDNWRVRHEVHKAERFMKRVVRKNKDTLFIVFADHGHINAKYLDVCEHDDLYSLLSNKMTLEKRTPSFFVKKGKEKEFEESFNKYYGDKFELFTKKQALDMNFFGEGKPAPGVLETFGDYVAYSKTEYSLYASKEFDRPGLHKGHHAGGTKEERLIDISIFNR